MLFITDDEVRALVSLDAVIDAVEGGFARTADPGTVNLLRERLYSGTTRLNLLGGAFGRGRMAVKAYTGGPHAVVLLFDADGALLAVIESRTLSLLRTAAASAVAVRWLARDDASRAGIIGTGWQAAGQLRAIARVRDLTEVRAWSPTPAHVRRFAAELGAELDLEVVPAIGPREAVDGTDLVVAATKATAPVLEADWLTPGVHLTLMGANQAQRREASAAAIGACDLVTVDDVAQARIESGDLMVAVDAAAIGWDDVVAFGDVVTGRAPGRTSREQRTLFKSLGVGIEDVAAASLVYDRAVTSSAGHTA